MTYQQFKALPRHEQLDVTIGKGVFLADRCTPDFIILLYQIGAFYVELYHNSESIGFAFLKSFDTTEALQPYLERIDVTTMVS